MKGKKIVLLAGRWDTTAIVYQQLDKAFGVSKVIMEEPVPRKEFLKKRAKKMGWVQVGGQVLFSMLVAKPLSKFSQSRIEAIIRDYNLSREAIPEEKLIHVPSVNTPETINALTAINPDVVIVHGTRIISKKVLASLTCPVINIHAGITPQYRGSHGAYWALANNDKENCGVTVHSVDAGIDTGGIIAQTTIPFTSADNFTTYPYLQLAEGLKLLVAFLNNGEKRFLQPDSKNRRSGLWHHPTLWGYLKTRWQKGVK